MRELRSGPGGVAPPPGRQWPSWLWLVPLPLTALVELLTTPGPLAVIASFVGAGVAARVLIGVLRSGGELTAGDLAPALVGIAAGLVTAVAAGGAGITVAWVGVVLVAVLVRDGRRLVAALLALLLAVAPVAAAPGEPVFTMAMVTALAVATAIGASSRTQRFTAERWRTEAIELERRRLAAELHDVVAHEVTGIVVLSQAAARIQPDGPQADAFARIEQAGLRALAQIRAMVTTLRDPETSQAAPLAPTRAGPAGIAEAVAAHPGPVTFDDGSLDAAAADPAGWLLLARVATEALTNVRRHAGARTPVHIALRSDAWGRTCLSIVDEGGSGGIGGGSGTGLESLRERAGVIGASVAAGPVDGGGWSVAVTLPPRHAQRDEDLA